MSIQTKASLRYIEAIRQELLDLTNQIRFGSLAAAEQHEAVADRLSALGTDVLWVAAAELIEMLIAEVHRQNALVHQRDDEHRDRLDQLDRAHHLLDQLGVGRCPASGGDEDPIAYDDIDVRIQALVASKA